MDELMKYALIISAFAPDPDMQAKRLTEFLSHSQTGEADGTGIVFYDPKKADEKKLAGLSKQIPAARVFCVSAEEYVPERALAFLKEVLSDMDFVFFPGNYFGEELSVRLSTRLRGSSLTGVLGMDWDGRKLTARRKIYSGHLIGTFRLPKKPYVIAVDKNYPAFSEALAGTEQKLIFRTLDLGDEKPDIKKYPVETESVLDHADCVAVAGRGLKNKETVEMVSGLADAISVPLVGSRPCVMNAWLPMNRLIGVSGSSISPKVSILLGVSGAPALYSGIGKSSHIIAVNQDREAPIMKKADLAVCADCVEQFQAFVKIVQERHHENEPDSEHFR